MIVYEIFSDIMYHTFKSRWRTIYFSPLAIDSFLLICGAPVIHVAANFRALLFYTTVYRYALHNSRVCKLSTYTTLPNHHPQDAEKEALSAKVS